MTSEMYEHTMKSDAANPYAWMLEGVEQDVLSNIKTMGIEKWVEETTRTAISGQNQSDLSDDEVYEAWKNGTDEFEQIVTFINSKIEESENDSALESVMTSREIANEFGIDESAVRKAIERGTLRARQSGATWLVSRKEAQRRWGKSMSAPTSKPAIAEVVYNILMSGDKGSIDKMLHSIEIVRSHPNATDFDYDVRKAEFSQIRGILSDIREANDARIKSAKFGTPR